jgi:hypothetical protein
MSAPSPHEAAVEAWLQTSVPAGSELDALQRALDALWLRARATLGEITLTAISERALYDAAERFPAFAAIDVDTNGIRCGQLRPRIASMTADELREATSFVLVTLLTVLGNLTAEILTPALHEELARVTMATPQPPAASSSAGEDPDAKDRKR